MPRKMVFLQEAQNFTPLAQNTETFRHRPQAQSSEPETRSLKTPGPKPEAPGPESQIPTSPRAGPQYSTGRGVNMGRDKKN